MELFNKIKNFIAHLEQKEFYKYSGILLGVLLALVMAILYYNYSRVNFWKKQINKINDEREEIRTILEKDQQVLSQRAEVNTMLTEIPDFKIDGYFTTLVGKLGFIGAQKPTTEVRSSDREDPEYQEVLLTARFDTMNMKQLSELLDEIEQNGRIYTKDLEIIKSKKTPDAIMVNLTIATLQRKPENTEQLQ